MVRTRSWLLGTARLCAIVIAAIAGGCGGEGAAPSTGIGVATPKWAAPGEVVTLAAALPTSAPERARYRWYQVTGAPVELLGDSSAITQFVMPRVSAREELEFVVEVQPATGELRRELHAVTCTEPQTPPPPPPGIAPDFAVFLAFKDLPSRGDLYLARLDGSALFRLNAPLLPVASGAGGAAEPVLSPDRRYVAYVAVENVPALNVHVARTDGGGEVQVSSVPPGNAGAILPAWAPDSSRIAYLAAEDGDPSAPRELYTVRPDGSDRVKVSGPLVSGGSVWNFAWAPDGSRIVYSADQYTAGQLELFTVHPDGTENVRVSGPIVPGGTIWTPFGSTWSSDSSRVAYLATQLDPNTTELFTSKADGSENTRASGELVEGGMVTSFQWAPDATRIAYVARQRFLSVEELFSSRPDGTENTQVSGPIRRRVWAYAWSPDGTRIAYEADLPTGLGLFASGPDGSSYGRIADPSLVGTHLVGWAPDSSRVAFTASLEATLPAQLFTVRPDGSEETQVSGPVGNTPIGVIDAAWDPTSSRIAFRAGTLVQDGGYEHWARYRLYTTAPDGTERVAVSPASDFADVSGFAWTSDGHRLVYRSDQYVDETNELFVAGPTGDTVNARISGPLVEGGYVYTFLVP